VDQADRTGNAKLLKLDLDVFYYAAWTSWIRIWEYFL
jgi:hypothetical protein